MYFKGINSDSCPSEDWIFVTTELAHATKAGILAYGSSPQSHVVR